MVSDALGSLPTLPAAPLCDEAFCRLALHEELPPLGLSLDELLSRVQPERKAA